MTIHEMLTATAKEMAARDDAFVHHANAFPARLVSAMRTYLGASEPLVSSALLHQPRKSPWEWEEFSGSFSASDQDEEGFFKIAIRITFPMDGSNTFKIQPVFGFRPTHEGMEVYIMERKRDYLQKNDRFVISWDNGEFQPLLDKSVELWGQMLRFDPFGEPKKTQLGFDLTR
jgi:hypothetical protein